jgi:two-component system CitB family sensor kinase
VRTRVGSSWSLASRILLLQAVVLVVVIGSALVALLWETGSDTERATAARVTALAQAVAAAPDVAQAVTANYPAGQEITGASALLQPYAEAVRTQTTADFVVIMRPDGIRYTHPDRTQIGQRYIGTRDAALAGGIGVETSTGTLGPSVRAIVPVTADGRVVALVSIGVTVDNVNKATTARLAALALIVLGALVVGVIGSLIIARWVRRQTLGMGTQELARMFTYYDAVLGSVHEGMVLLDSDGRIVSVNTEGRRLLGLTDEAIGVSAARAGLPSQIAELIDTLDELTDELVLSDDRVLLISRRPVVVKGSVVGAVITLRDHTELASVSGELDRAEGFSDALRAQAHESANRLHTVISLIELGETDHALTFAVGELETAQALADRVLEGVGNRAVAALLLAKSAQAAERGIELTIGSGSVLPEDLAPDYELVTILGNLIDNAFEVLTAQPTDRARRVEVASERVDGGVRITVTDNGPGLTVEQAGSVFTRGWSTKAARGPAGDRGLGLALVAQAVNRCRGTVLAEPGPGARFVVWLPVRDAQSDETPSAVSDPAGTARSIAATASGQS